MSSVIDQLREDSNYYGGLGKSYLSNSDIGVLLSNPKAFRKEREESKALAEGRLFHQLMLEPEKIDKVPFVNVSSRNTKEYKNFCEENNIDFVMLKKEVDEIQDLVSVMKGNINFFLDIYQEGNLYEEPMVKEIKGMLWKGKADIITKNCIIDLKTTSDINKFKKSAKLYNYDSQCYIYQQLFGKPLVFYVIDKETHQLGVYRPTENFIKGGELKVEAAIEVYNRYFAEDSTEDISNYYRDETLD
jgi:hypothetical protein